jgi:inositol oxygenase
MPTTTCTGRDLDAISDAIDEGESSELFSSKLMERYDPVNILVKKWNDKSDFGEDVDKSQFRQYESACDRVKNFYREQHGMSSLYSFQPSTPHVATTEKQTVAFNIKARVDFKTKKRARMGIWEALEKLNTVIDESDPDVNRFLVSCRHVLTYAFQAGSQIHHALQTAEAIRQDGKPEWMQVCTSQRHTIGKRAQLT